MKKKLSDILNSRPMVWLIPIMMIISVFGLISGRVDTSTDMGRFSVISFVLGTIGLTCCILYEVRKQKKSRKSQ